MKYNTALRTRVKATPNETLSEGKIRILLQEDLHGNVDEPICPCKGYWVFENDSVDFDLKKL